MSYKSTKILELGSCAFRQWRAEHSHCKLIHGYRLVAKFWFTCESLDDKNWVVDFGGLKGLKHILEKQFDHTFCVAADDPLLEKFKELHNLGALDLRIMDKGVGIERTAEWCFIQADKHVREITNNRCSVEKVEVWEHEKNSAIFSIEKNNAITERHVEKHAELKPETCSPIANVVAAPAPEVQHAANVNSAAAKVGNKVSSGFGNLFAGTSWGS